MLYMHAFFVVCVCVFDVVCALCLFVIRVVFFAFVCFLVCHLLALLWSFVFLFGDVSV